MYSSYARALISSEQFWGAFAGASFAFLFGLITYFITKRYERFFKHVTAAVKLEYALIGQVDYIQIAQHDIGAMLDALKNNANAMNRINILPIESGFFDGTKSLYMANRYFQQRRRILIFNQNAERFNHILDRFEELSLISIQQAPNKIIGPHSTTITMLVAGLKSNLEELRKLLIDTEKLLAELHLHQDYNKNLKYYLLFWYPMSWEKKEDEETIQNEIKSPRGIKNNDQRKN